MENPNLSCPCAVVELKISCKALRSADKLSKSDPMVVLYEFFKDETPEIELGRTECISDNHSPIFKTEIRFEYFFERAQMLRFLVIDIDNRAEVDRPINLKPSNHLGELSISPARLFGRHEALFPLVDNKGGKISGGAEIRIQARNLNKQETFTVQFSAKNLDKKDAFGKSDPFLVLYRLSPSGEKTMVCKTEIIKKTLNPTWKTLSIFLGHLVDYNDGLYAESSILIECFDWNAITKHSFIGAATVTLNLLLQKNAEILLTNPKKAKKTKSTESGTLLVNFSNVKSKQSFVDFLRGGAEISMAVSIDFTGSNGHPADPSSLHHIAQSGAWNPYMRAIYSVGTVLAPYDSNQRFPVYGFGAKFPGTTNAVHNFHVNFDPEDAQVKGVEGIIAAYSNCVSQIALSGPTNFAPVINHYSRFVTGEMKPLSYYIMLIITDGVITDMSDTKDAIAKAANLPISILIVGVGGASFDSMVELDGDQEPLCDSRGNRVPRDIVQFVPMREHENDDGSRLAKAVLHEIPNQFLEYMEGKSIYPVFQSPIMSPV